MMAIYKVVNTSEILIHEPVLYQGGVDLTLHDYQLDINLARSTFWIKYKSKETRNGQQASRLGTFKDDFNNGVYIVSLKFMIDGKMTNVTYSDICKDFQKYKQLVEREFELDAINTAIDNLP